MSRRTKKREPFRFHGWRRLLLRSLRYTDPALRRPRARWKGMLAALRRGPQEPIELRYSDMYLNVLYSPLPPTPFRAG